jgi:hypothetical protein
LISERIKPDGEDSGRGDRIFFRAGRIFRMEINDTSITTREGRSPRSFGARNRAFTA